MMGEMWIFNDNGSFDDMFEVLVVTIENKGRFRHYIVDSFVIQRNEFVPFRHNCGEKKSGENDEEMEQMDENSNQYYEVSVCIVHIFGYVYCEDSRTVHGKGMCIDLCMERVCT